MPVYLNGLQVVNRANFHFWQASSRTTIETVWGRLGPRFDPRLTSARAIAMLATHADHERAFAAGHGLDIPAPGRSEQEFAAVPRTLAAWLSDARTRRFANDDELARALTDATNVQQRRNNYFTTVAADDENFNPHQVIYRSTLPEQSIGWTQTAFFEQLGNDRNPVGSDARNMEQEYLLQNMIKGAMYDAAEIANTYNVGISVRGTGLLAHMGIESGDPTKAQEYKNKTSKEVDLFLCNELKWEDLGAVVHYDPRVGWNSARAQLEAQTGAVRGAPTHAEWVKKRNWMKLNRIPQLRRAVGDRMRYPGTDAELDAQLKPVFMDRAKEYREEDHEYRMGHYAPYTEIVGPYIRIRQRPHQNMYGDHDLFGFTMLEYGRLVHDSAAPLQSVQVALQRSNTFQAQHGGVWNWAPTTAFNMGIKQKIMGSHSPPKGDPLVYILPGYKVNAAFYIPGVEVLRSVWDCPTGTEWMKKTPTGKSSYAQFTGMLDADSPLLRGMGFG
jgi:hypothetical protein